jgi:hypothetical protein
LENLRVIICCWDIKCPTSYNARQKTRRKVIFQAAFLGWENLKRIVWLDERRLDSRQVSALGTPLDMLLVTMEHAPLLDPWNHV